MTQIIVVFGATGAQGGGVVKALLKDDKFKVLAVTRNTTSEKAKSLQSLGVDVVEGNLDDRSRLIAILTGCHGVYGVTDYWEHTDKNKEIQHGKNLVDACKASCVKHLIYSGMDSVKDAIGKECPHLDSKNEVEKYMFASGVPCTSVRYSTFMETLLKVNPSRHKKDSDGKFVIGIPMEGKPMDMIDCTGAGRAVAAIFASPNKYIGKVIGLTGDWKTIPEYADILSKHLTPKIFKASEITAEQFAKIQGFSRAPELSVGFEFMQSGKQERDLALTKELDPSTLNFEDWVKANREALDAVFAY